MSEEVIEVRVVTTKTCHKAKLLIVAEAIQGRCSVDRHCRSHNIAAECCVVSKELALEDSATGRSSGEREAGFTVRIADCMLE